MKTVIIEDETAAAVNLKVMLGESFPEIEVIAFLESITDVIEWFSSNSMPDLVFMDIHLADGNAFKIFDSISITCPIIFTTAYDQYALEAFRVNSIDYLLKPINANDLNRAISKMKRLEGHELKEYSEQISRMIRRTNTIYTFLVIIGDKIIPVKSDEIAFFYTMNEKVTAYTEDSKEMPIDKTLETIMTLLPKHLFFRANRQFIISRKYIKDISIWFGNRLSVNMSVRTPEKIIISKARAPEFKQWLADNE